MTNNNISTGITIDNFYNNNVFLLNYKEYNTIPDVIFNKHDNILTIWIDSKDNKYKGIFNDVHFVENRLENVPNEYFLKNEIDEIIITILNYLSINNNI